MTDRDRDALKIGDLITLKSVLREGYLSAEGILADYVYIQDDLSLFDECIFMVQLQRQYCASSELERYLSTFVVNTDEEDDNTIKYIKALEVCSNIFDMWCRSDFCYQDLFCLFYREGVIMKRCSMKVI